MFSKIQEKLINTNSVVQATNKLVKEIQQQAEFEMSSNDIEYWDSLELSLHQLGHSIDKTLITIIKEQKENKVA